MALLEEGMLLEVGSESLKTASSLGFMMCLRSAVLGSDPLEHKPK